MYNCRDKKIYLVINKICIRYNTIMKHGAGLPGLLFTNPGCFSLFSCEKRMPLGIFVIGFYLSSAFATCPHTLLSLSRAHSTGHPYHFLSVNSSDKIIIYRLFCNKRRAKSDSSSSSRISGWNEYFEKHGAVIPRYLSFIVSSPVFAILRARAVPLPMKGIPLFRWFEDRTLLVRREGKINLFLFLNVHLSPLSSHRGKSVVTQKTVTSTHSVVGYT